jgi:hypothetical protein
MKNTAGMIMYVFHACMEQALQSAPLPCFLVVVQDPYTGIELRATENNAPNRSGWTAAAAKADCISPYCIISSSTTYSQPSG